MRNAPEIHSAILRAKSIDDLAAIEAALIEIKGKLSDKSHQYLTDAMLAKLDSL